jgi:predicted RNA binding protein YcfA (HicA-like mRNA interferase family)
MSPIIPFVSGKEMIRALEKIGYNHTRTKGSHARLEHPLKPKITVPLHKTLKLGLALKIIKDAGLTVNEFKNLL